MFIQLDILWSKSVLAICKPILHMCTIDEPAILGQGTKICCYNYHSLYKKSTLLAIILYRVIQHQTAVGAARGQHGVTTLQTVPALGKHHTPQAKYQVNWLIFATCIPSCPRNISVMNISALNKNILTFLYINQEFS